MLSNLQKVGSSLLNRSRSSLRHPNTNASRCPNKTKPGQQSSLIHGTHVRLYRFKNLTKFLKILILIVFYTDRPSFMLSHLVCFDLDGQKQFLPSFYKNSHFTFHRNYSVFYAKGGKYKLLEAPESEELRRQMYGHEEHSNELIDLQDWPNEIHHILRDLMNPDMDLERAKRVWQQYSKMVHTHPELRFFLRRMFYRLSSFLYFDHIETIYADIVTTDMLTASVGRVMIRKYYERNNLEMATSVLQDLLNSKIDPPISALALLIKMNGDAGNINKAWQYFDMVAMNPSDGWAYVCGLMLGALGTPNQNHDLEIHSILHKMITGEPYYPNSIEYYEYQESLKQQPQNDQIDPTNENSQEQANETIMPDFPIPQAVQLPLPTAFCFNSAFCGVKSMKLIETIWDYARSSHKTTSHVYASYVSAVSRIDVDQALVLFKEFLDSPFANHDWTANQRIRHNLVQNAAKAGNTKVIMEVLYEKHTTRHVQQSDIVVLAGVYFQQGNFEMVKKTLKETSAQFGVNVTKNMFRVFLIEYLKLDEYEKAQLLLEEIRASGLQSTNYHLTPFALYNLQQMLITLQKKQNLIQNNASKDELDQVDQALENFTSRFEEYHQQVMQGGPKLYYVKVLCKSHPSEEWVKEFLDNLFLHGKISSGVLFPYLHEWHISYERGSMIIDYMLNVRKFNLLPPAAMHIIKWAVYWKKYKRCFDLAIQVVKSVRESKGKQFILGEWVYTFSTIVLRPFKISTPLHKQCDQNSYHNLNDTQLLQLELELPKWRASAARHKFKDIEMRSEGASQSEPTTNLNVKIFDYDNLDPEDPDLDPEELSTGKRKLSDSASERQYNALMDKYSRPFNEKKKKI